MSSADLIVNIAVKTAVAPIRAFTGAWGSMWTTIRSSMRTFRDVTIIFYGVRRAFDLFSRAMKGSFAAAGGQGVDQLNQIEQAWENMSASFGRAIQRTNLWREVFSGLTDTLRDGVNEVQVAKWIDQIAAGLIQVVIALAEVNKFFIQFFNVVARSANAIASFFGGSSAKAQQLTDKIGDLKNSLAAMEANAMAGGQGAAASVASIKKEIEGLRRERDALGGGLFDERSTENVDAFIARLEKLKLVLLSGGQTESKIAGVFTTEYWDKTFTALDADIKGARRSLKGLGSEWVTVFSNAFENMPTHGGSGIRETFYELGKDAGKAFKQQFGKAVFAPMEQSFQLLAEVAALPFRIIGNVFNRLIVAPIANFVSSLVPEIGAAIVAQQTTAQAAATAARAASVAETIPYGIAIESALGPAAVAAAISSFGAANAFGIEAFAQIKAAAIPLAEGGIVQARSGGTLALLGERGKNEAVIPLDEAGNALNGLRGGAPIRVVVYGDLQSKAHNRRLARDLGRRIRDETTSNSYGGGRKKR